MVCRTPILTQIKRFGSKATFQNSYLEIVINIKTYHLHLLRSHETDHEIRW